VTTSLGVSICSASSSGIAIRNASSTATMNPPPSSSLCRSPQFCVTQRR
jgi:hypothetical protein